MNWKTWLKGLAAAAIGGGATGATEAITNSGTVNKMTGVTAAVSALATLLAYLIKSPLNGEPSVTPVVPSAPAETPKP